MNLVADQNVAGLSIHHQPCDSLERSLDDVLTTDIFWMDDETQQTMIKDLWDESLLPSLVEVRPTSRSHQNESEINNRPIAHICETSADIKGLPDKTHSVTNHQTNNPTITRCSGQKRNNFVQLRDNELRDLKLKELNKLLSEKPKDEATRIRKRRRSLKNREYSQKTRSQEQQRQFMLKGQVARLESELSRVQAELIKTKKERDLYKNQIILRRSNNGL